MLKHVMMDCDDDDDHYDDDDGYDNANFKLKIITYHATKIKSK